jgi:hypothetical protein
MSELSNFYMCETVDYKIGDKVYAFIPKYPDLVNDFEIFDGAQSILRDSFTWECKTCGSIHITDQLYENMICSDCCNATRTTL